MAANETINRSTACMETRRRFCVKDSLFYFCVAGSTCRSAADSLLCTRRKRCNVLPGCCPLPEAYTLWEKNVGNHAKEIDTINLMCYHITNMSTDNINWVPCI